MADQIRVAVASNFSKAITALAEQYENDTEHTVTLIFGSTGKHYAQIINGAPYDAFFAADSARPKLLEKNGQSILKTRFTYAIGKLVLWSPKAGYINDELSVLTQNDFRFLAIANPKLAPYGQAAQEVLERKGYWPAVKDKLVRGENIAQTYQFVKTANAELGFVALSQVMQIGQSIEGSYWHVPQSLHAPIDQQALSLNNKPAVQKFMEFVKSDAGQAIIRSYGYDTP